MSLEFEDEKKMTVNDIFKSVGIVIAVVLIGYLCIQKFTSASKPHIVRSETSEQQQVASQDKDVEDAYEWVFTSPTQIDKGDRAIRQDLRDNVDLMKYVDSDTGFEFQIPQFCTGCFVDQQSVDDIPEWPEDVYSPRVFSVKNGSVILAQVIEVSSDYVDLFSQYKFKLTTLLEITPQYSYYLVSGKDLVDQSFDQTNWPIADFGYADWGSVVQCIYSTFWIPESSNFSEDSGSSGVNWGGSDSPEDDTIDFENSQNNSENSVDVDAQSYPDNSEDSEDSTNAYIPGQHSNPVNSME